MIQIYNLERNIKLGFDLGEDLPEDFDIIKSEHEKWVPFVLNISTPANIIAITKDMRAYMTIYEIRKIFYDLKELLSSTKNGEDAKMGHYSNESFFEFTLEYLHTDDCFWLEFWFIIAKYPEGEVIGYDMGFRFNIGKTEMISFINEFYSRFKEVCPQVDL